MAKEVCIGGSKEASMRVAVTAKDANGNNTLVLQDYPTAGGEDGLSECVI